MEGFLRWNTLHLLFIGVNSYVSYWLKGIVDPN